MSTIHHTRHLTLVIAVMALVLVGGASLLGAVQAQPSVTLSTNSGIPGTLVTVYLSGYSSSDSSCTISGTPVADPTSCSLSGGSGTLTFTVKQYVPAGTYIITVTGNSAKDSGQVSFRVSGISLSLNPSSGPGGTEVSFTITNAPTNDTSCSVSSQPNGAATNSACVVSDGSGSGTFVVGNVSTGDYVIEVTACTGNNGCSPSQGDFSQQEFTVTARPMITLDPSSAGVGVDVAVTGTDFPVSDQSCSISSPTNPSVVQNSACAPSSGTGDLHGSFIVGNVPIGQYVIEVTACSGNNGCTPSQGAFAQEVLTVVTTAPLLISLNPSEAGPWTNVAVSGTGFSTSDTSCSISSEAVASSTCSVTGGEVTGSFTVANVGSGLYSVTVTGSSGDSASVNFKVGPQSVLAIPSFPIEAILAGLLLGSAIAVLLRKRHNDTTQRNRCLTYA
jgi:hypothetical protein